MSSFFSDTKIVNVNDFKNDTEDLASLFPFIRRL